MTTTDDRLPLGDRLDAVSAALDHGQPRAAAEGLLGVWRASRDPAVAELYGLLIRAHARPVEPSREPSEPLGRWLARLAAADPTGAMIGDPLVLPGLLAEPPLDAADEASFVAALTPWTPDPLLAEGLAARLRWPRVAPSGGDSHQIRHAAHRLRSETLHALGRQGDPRQGPALDLIQAQPKVAEVRDALRSAAAALARVEPLELGPRTAAALTRLDRRLSARRAHEARAAELLAAVYADPEADEPRLVYADWLTDVGDPRGELIALQLAQPTDPGAVFGQARARERELLRAHGRRWAGRLDGLLGPDGREFERGFLAAAAVEVPDLAGELARLPEWATLRRLDGHVSEPLARHGPLTGLRELYGFLQLDRFVALRREGALPQVHTFEASLADPNLDLDVPLGLRRLLVRRALDARLSALCEAEALVGVEQLGLYYGSSSSFAADHRERRSVGHRFSHLRGRLPAQVRVLELLDDDTIRASRPRGWVLRFERDPLGRFARLRLDWHRPAEGRSDLDALYRLRELLAELDLGELEALELGAFDQPCRSLAESWLSSLAAG